MRYKVAEAGALTEGGRLIVSVRGMELGLFLINGKYRAWRNVCPHAAAPVCVGMVTGTRLLSNVYEYEYGLDRQVLRCPWHGWEFDLATGRHLAGGAAKLRGFEVEADDTGIYVVLSGKE
ncbi:Rieske (2Fe-2S) protein [Paenibacillus koleovorans]|uniref:Rieske (2Fe-2S) protein n=1 Tax=Paenibacillus koleovorans TaxID=121608 RepID=UPI000FDC76B6|nr:Rieske (2Fe-2S) protein [Paenibacillus koleovorans]